MIFRSLAISSSLLALLASGSVMAMEPEALSLPPLKRRAPEEHQPEAICKKQKILSPEEMLQTYPLTSKGNEKLKEDAINGDEALQDEAMRRHSLGLLNFNREDTLLKDFLNWENIEERIVNKPGYGKILRGYYGDHLSQFFEAIKEFAQLEIPLAQYNLGAMLRHGVADKNRKHLVDSDPLKAKALWESAAEKGISDAQYDLGNLLRKGAIDRNGRWLVAPDLLKAKTYYEAAAQNGHGQAEFDLGEMFQYGEKVENEEWIVAPDPLKAKAYYKKAAKKGISDAQYNLACLLRDGVKDGNGEWIVFPDLLKAKTYYEAAAEMDFSDAQYDLGHLLREGVKDGNGEWLIEPDLLKAKALWESAAEMDFSDAQYDLGHLLREGVKDRNGRWLIEPDPLKAKKLWEDAIGYEHDAAQLELGKMLQDGVKATNGRWLVVPDPLRAKELFDQLIEAGFENDNPILIEAQYNLGLLLYSGRKDKNGRWLIEPDLPKTKELWEAAALEEHKNAQNKLQLFQPLAPELPQNDSIVDSRASWKFNPLDLRDATVDELKLYDEIIEKIEGTPISLAEKTKAKNALLRFKTLHAKNTAICGELMESPVVRNYSEKIYAVIPGDILIHPEQGDASLEQRAHIIYNILETTYVGVKEDPTSLEKFFKEAFTDTIPCLEAQSRKIDDWRTSQESFDVKINSQSIVQNIGEHANKLLEGMKENSETGQKLIKAQQDYQKFSEKLQKMPNFPVEHPQYHKLKEAKEFFGTSLQYISQSVEILEKSHEKWLEDNNKYVEMHQNLLTTLVGKMAQDGEITENAINEILSELGWTFGASE